MRLNDDFPLAKQISAKLRISLTDGAAIWNSYNDRYALFAFFRDGSPKWVAAGSPQTAQTPAEVSRVVEARSKANIPADADADFSRLFGHARYAGGGSDYGEPPSGPQGGYFYYGNED